MSQRTGAYFETVKDLCDQVWQNILEQANGYDRVDVVPDDYSNEHPIKAIARLLRGGYGTKVSFELNSRIVAKISKFLDNKDNKDCLYTIMAADFHQKALECDNQQHSVPYRVIHDLCRPLPSQNWP